MTTDSLIALGVITLGMLAIALCADKHREIKPAKRLYKKPTIKR